MTDPLVTVDDLHRFHTKHFPAGPLPNQFFQNVELEAEAVDVQYEEESCSLGYYEDGVKRTLTNEQVAMFRHTEIQTILRNRRRLREADTSSEEEYKAQTTEDMSHGTTANALRENTEKAQAQSVSLQAVQSGRVEKKQGQGQGPWIYSSEKSKGRQRRKNKNYKQNKQRRKIDARKRSREGSVGSIFSGEGEEGQEKDEWDPWQQATGPDAQIDTAVDLEY